MLPFWLLETSFILVQLYFLCSINPNISIYLQLQSKLILHLHNWQLIWAQLSSLSWKSFRIPKPAWFSFLAGKSSGVVADGSSSEMKQCENTAYSFFHSSLSSLCLSKQCSKIDGEIDFSYATPTLSQQFNWDVDFWIVILLCWFKCINSYSDEQWNNPSFLLTSQIYIFIIFSKCLTKRLFL